MQTPCIAAMEFHVSRAARDRYQFSDTLFSLSGNMILANFHAAQLLAQKMNDQRDLVRHPEQAVKAGQINTMGLIDEILHFVAGMYRKQVNPHVMEQALDALLARHSQQAVDDTLLRFVTEFPPVAVYRGEQEPAAYLNGTTGDIPNRHLVLEELLLLWLANANPASGPFQELFDDTALKTQSAYLPVIAGLHEFFERQPPFGPDRQNLVDMLRWPAVAIPLSLSGQLNYILDRWGYLLGEYTYRLLRGLDVIREEERPVFGGGPGPAHVYQFIGTEIEREPERFSPDREWMPQCVLIAKNTYVWLDQLSRKHDRRIHRLDQVPDEELDTLARSGFSGLWLIGLWERSRASQKIKQFCGNPEAVASAYSLYEYQIAADIGGEEAYQSLRARAWRRGVRLASDMVPNHMGIDSRWLVEHPDWFISVDQSPFPSYQFTGPDLSSDGRVAITLEDHYFTRTDAAVVFKRVDRATGSTRYVYHGNDGTSMPWNDTAQLNYLNPEVREAVIQTILNVARQFPIIRFDAAMTLTKKHYQRLWFPEPGIGGAIPSRSEHGMTREQFDALMPNEFWREVVDRVAREVPDTLLLAEAFWMMEGYFVRTLGMHRVYNSAFMNMLKNEDNANYRTVMKNTLEFNPEVLKRFVNFMNNPDEDTAVAQFGKDDKYFGVCTLMATLPGLPMFGHGQVEGLTEKYGMEYRRAYRDEKPDVQLVERHEREIFPLLRRRRLFAEVEHFLLYDFFTVDGQANEDVFAYSNQAGGERAVVVYHNKYASTRGWIRTSVGFAGKTGRGEDRAIMQKDLASGLGLQRDPDVYCIFRDHVTGLEYIRSNAELREKGLYLELDAFKYRVFLNFHEVTDSEERPYGRLNEFLDRKGVPSMEEALKEMLLQPIHAPFKELINADVFQQLLEAREGDTPEEAKEVVATLEKRLLRLFRAIKQFARASGDERALARQTRRELEVVLRLPEMLEQLSSPSDSQELSENLDEMLRDEPASWCVLLGWAFTHALGKLMNDTKFPTQSRAWLDEWLLGRLLAQVFTELGLDEEAARGAIAVLRILTTHQRWFELEAPEKVRAYKLLETLLRDADGQHFLQVNRYQDVLWLSKEAFDRLLDWLLLVALIDSAAQPRSKRKGASDHLPTDIRTLQKLRAAGEEAEYQVERLLTGVRS
jgi:glycosidase